MTTCQYCNQPCFVPLPTDPAIRQAYESRGVTVMATCPGGQLAEKRLLGYCYDDTEERVTQKPDILDDVIKTAPIIDGQKWAIFGVHCLWWTTFPDDIARNGITGGCCPFCGGPIDKRPLAEFVKAARHKAQHQDFAEGGYGPGGLATLMKAHHRSARTCRVRWDRVGVRVRK